MKCNLHTLDYTSIIGVCASCLRDRLLPIAAAREHTLRHQSTPTKRFPTSVSPYIPRRKSDTRPDLQHHHRNFPGQKFFSTPQIGPNFAIIDDDHQMEKKKKKSRFSMISNLFKFRTGKRVPESEETVDSVDQSAIKYHMKINEAENCIYSDEGYQFQSNDYSSVLWRQTPKISTTSEKRSGGRKSDSSRNWRRKDGFASEVVLPGEIVLSEKLQESNASPFWRKGSNKLVAFGRHDRGH